MVTRTTGCFPLASRTSALRQALGAIEESAAALDEIGQEIARRLHAGGIVYTAGNGGAATMSQHLSAELVGRLSAQRERRPLAAVSLAVDAATLTALGNDYGFSSVFARQLAGCGRSGDVLVMFSTSGQSENLIAADRVAAQAGIYRVALLGSAPSPLEACDGVLRVEAGDPGTIQECHLLLLHALTEVVENACRDVTWLPG
jgi:phosphoheptose isomerase